MLVGGNTSLPAEVSLSYVGSESICISFADGPFGLISICISTLLLLQGFDVVAFCSLWTVKKTRSGGLKPAVSSG